MESVKVRNTIIGEGMPKICIPIVGVTFDDVLAEARAITALPADIVEWRIDWFEDVFDPSRLADALGDLREILGDIPLLLTFRTAKEGGEKAVDPETYADIIINAARTGLVDMVDVELFTGDEVVKRIINEAHAAGAKVIVSNHDFAKTPAKDELVRRLRKMEDLGADISKIAVMPNSPADVVTLLTATEEMTRNYAKKPIVTMSMGDMGVISRVAGEAFGSAITFGAAGHASAPGQLDASDLHDILKKLHDKYSTIKG